MKVPTAFVNKHPQSFFSAVLILTKARLTFLVLVTTAAGFYLANEPGAFRWTRFIATLAGTGLVAAAAAILNQWIERAVDARMRRTQQRPLPTGRFQPWPVLVAGCIAALLGVLILASIAPFAAGLALLTLTVYLLAYTPLKPATTFNTLVGAIPGALPPVIGWTAAGRGWDEGATALFAILFFWQLPHFYAIAWLYKDDYRAAGLRMLAVTDATGKRTGWHTVIGSVLLLIVSLWPWNLGLAGTVYTFTALALGTMQLVLAACFLKVPSDSNARRLFLMSIVYLPIILIVMTANQTGIN